MSDLSVRESGWGDKSNFIRRGDGCSAGSNPLGVYAISWVQCEQRLAATWNLAQALRAGLGSGRSNYLGVKLVHQGIDGQQHQEVNRRGNDQKRDQYVQESRRI